jgi:hypothetical protein
MTRNSERYSDYRIEPPTPEIYHRCKVCGSDFNENGELIQDFEKADNSETIDMTEPCEACYAFIAAEKLANLNCIYKFALKNRFNVEKTVADCKKDNLYFHVDRIAEIIELLTKIDKITL